MAKTSERLNGKKGARAEPGLLEHVRVREGSEEAASTAKSSAQASTREPTEHGHAERSPERNERRNAERKRAEAKKAAEAPFSIRLRGEVIEAIGEAVKRSPIEFASSAEFIKRAIETELRRRGLIKTYKD